MKVCYDHLTSEVAPGQPYYSPVNDLEVERTKAKIIELIKEGQEKEIISVTVTLIVNVVSSVSDSTIEIKSPPKIKKPSMEKRQAKRQAKRNLGILCHPLGSNNQNFLVA